MGKGNKIQVGDASEDGHPCEAALEFRKIAVRSDIIDEIPADVLDLAIQFAWIGKAVSRTQNINEWFLSHIDPNTHEMIVAMALDSSTRQAAVEHAISGKAFPTMDKSLRKIRTTQAFGHALKVVQSTCGKHPSVVDVERMGVLCSIASQLTNPKRLARSIKQDSVVSLEAFKKQRKARA